ncbi:MAG: Nif3-like dinuclear metal center hexameric protein [Saprospiraceae bacterium]|nr:Nif3-like dinuclear metal center hexameric protein [Saprospiraceae bacterium]MBK8450299.1 Nif3-like dinuclear metal center hexameric protein [Saprospiraceae bacterium]MBK9222840.1 Nif3-like dinuclear metal center hexameric protein [Saprospiraceae bacterium]MBK9720119.1 Nif3-like dinuclear metal center hexameric protein [Saprospiraceae bacterium]MBK9727112.1 Nif3-like dinuclear metal center hexameric protein [Saprospiraceae bacterium]
MKVNDLANYLESIAPLNLQEPYDNSGLIVGHPEMEIKGVMCSLDCTLAILEEAKILGCNVVVSHHPIIFKGLKKIHGIHYVDQAVMFAIKNDMAIYAIHTNLDSVFRHGVNEKIAKKLELKNLQILSPKMGNPEIGIGMFGNLEQEMQTQDFLKFVKDRMQTKLIRHTSFLKPTIKNVAVTGGAGAFLIQEAIQSGADIFITGDVKYHEFFEANSQIVLLDIGHFESEQFTIELLFGLISEKFRNFATHCTKISTNPVQYF